MASEINLAVSTITVAPNKSLQDPVAHSHDSVENMPNDSNTQAQDSLDNCAKNAAAKSQSESDDREDGEVSADDVSSNDDPTPICRFHIRNTCTWGNLCRFRHPATTDMGNYVMFERKQLPLPPFDALMMLPPLMSVPEPPIAEKAELDNSFDASLQNLKNMMQKAGYKKPESNLRRKTPKSWSEFNDMDTAPYYSNRTTRNKERSPMRSRARSAAGRAQQARTGGSSTAYTQPKPRLKNPDRHVVMYPRRFRRSSSSSSLSSSSSSSDYTSTTNSSSSSSPVRRRLPLRKLSPIVNQRKHKQISNPKPRSKRPIVTPTPFNSPAKRSSMKSSQRASRKRRLMSSSSSSSSNSCKKKSKNNKNVSKNKKRKRSSKEIARIDYTKLTQRDYLMKKLKAVEREIARKEKKLF